MILEGPSLCITEDKSKGEVHFKHSRLISKNSAELYTKANRTDCWQAEIVPVLQTVTAAKLGMNLRPVLTVRVSDIIFIAWNKVGRNENRMDLLAS